MTDRRTPTRIVAMACAVLATGAVARAQTVDPGIGRLSAPVLALAVQPDGKIVAGGEFGWGLCRFNADGSVDESFHGRANGDVLAVVVQTDGKILVGGNFSTLYGRGGEIGGTPRVNIGRFNSDTSIDTTFNPPTWIGIVRSLAVQADGKILFGTSHGASNLGRLNPDGSSDSSFGPAVNNAVRAVVVQPDGRILIGGQFTTLGGGLGMVPRNYLARVNADVRPTPASIPVRTPSCSLFALQADQKILVGGDFTTLGGGGLGTTARAQIGRLNADGSLDTSFNPGAGGPVHSLAVQGDDRILVGGLVQLLAGVSSGNRNTTFIFGRLTPDGSFDTSFQVSTNQSVRAIAVEADGNILAGGGFTILSVPVETGQHFYLARLVVESPAAPSITTHPSNQTVRAGRMASFSAAASGSPSPAVLWQASTNGGSTWVTCLARRQQPAHSR